MHQITSYGTMWYELFTSYGDAPFRPKMLTVQLIIGSDLIITWT